MVLMHDTLSDCALKCMKFLSNTYNGYQIIERTRNSNANDLRVITQKHPKQRYGYCAWHIVSLCSRRVWSVNQIQRCSTYREDKNCIWLCYKGNNLRKNIQELWFLCMTRCLNAVYKCMKFRWNISNGCQVIERTRICDGQTDGRKGKTI